MKITLISPYPDVTAFGLRTISAYLKKNGHTTQMIFLPDPYGDDIAPGIARYEDHILDEAARLCSDSGLIGITLMTNFFDGAVQITKKLKSAGIKAPVLWGGIHPTIRQDESLEHADMICIGDGEDAIVELVSRMEKGEPIHNTPNIGLRHEGRIIKNRPRKLSKEIDFYPMPDYSMEGHYVMRAGSIRPLTNGLLEEILREGTVSRYLNLIGYQTMTGRGCPHQCTYCINDTLKTMYNNDSYLRWRSTAHVMEELLWVKRNMPYIGFIWISDDAFFARNMESIEEFCREYKEKIGLPFTCLASPMTISEKKMDLLVDAGLIYIQMGVESGSANIQALFNRKQMNNDRLKKAFNIINKYKEKMYPPSYDFILDVPFETDQDKIESIKLIAEIPKPFQLQPFSLVLYPGTRLYEMAKKEGLIKDETSEIYSKSYTMRAPSYLNLLITLSKGGKFPAPALKLMISRPAVLVMNSQFMSPVVKGVYSGLRYAYRAAKRLAGKAA